MMSAIITGFIVLLFVVLLLAGKLRSRVYGFSDRNIYDAIPFLQQVDYDQLEALVDSASEQCLRANLGEEKFKNAQQKRMRLLLELVRRMDQNARVLLELGKSDRKRGWKYNQPEWVKLGEELVQASLGFRAGAVAIKFVLHRWLFRSVFFPFGRVPAISSLRKFDGFDLFESYQRMVNAALDLGEAYGDDVHKKLVVAL